MTDLATLRALYAHMVHLAADAFEEGNERLAAQAMRAASDLEISIQRISAHG